MNGLPKYTLSAGLGLIVVVNAIVLAGVAYNRSGEPESTLRLSERELRVPMPWRGKKDDSGLTLSLQWRVLPPESRDPNKFAWDYGSQGGSPEWLNREKMLTLGFDQAVFSQHLGAPFRTRRALPRDVLVVLELDGAAYQAALARTLRYSEVANAQEQTRANEALKREQADNSRLFVVDAGRDAAALRAHYPDRSRYAIVPGQVGPSWVIDKEGATPAGRVTGVSANSVNVPLQWRGVFDGVPAASRDGKALARYSVDVKFGQRLEPWIAGAARAAPSQ